MNIKIFVMTHKKFNIPKDEIYIPLQVGRSLHDDLGYLGDNTGDNISNQNDLYSELTGLYWAAKNVNDADYMGLCHYRRFFLNAQGQLLNEQEYNQLLTHYDVILPRATVYDKSYYKIYEEAHHIGDLQLTGEAIRSLYPEDYHVFEEIINGNKVFSGNLFATKAELFKEYTNWLFSIFHVVEKNIDVSTYDSYHKRVYGFLSEQLLYVWVTIRGLSVVEMPVGITQEKAETIELKQKLRELTAEGSLASIKEGLAVFRENMKKRPDLILGASDLSGELADMFLVLYICEGELEAINRATNEQNQQTMLKLTTDLDTLVKHYRLIKLIAEDIVKGKVTAEEKSYFKDARVSNFFLQTMINANPVLKPFADSLFRLSQ